MRAALTMVLALVVACSSSDDASTTPTGSGSGTPNLTGTVNGAPFTAASGLARVTTAGTLTLEFSTKPGLCQDVTDAKIGLSTKKWAKRIGQTSEARRSPGRGPASSVRGAPRGAHEGVRVEPRGLRSCSAAARSSRG